MNMRWPFVSRARLDLALHNLEEMRKRCHAAEDYRDVADNRLAWLCEKYDALLEKYHELAQPKVPEASAPVVIPEPRTPPRAVLAAIKAISPTRDKTYDANWAFWEANQERAELHPDAFAEEIMQGAVYEPVEVDA